MVIPVLPPVGQAGSRTSCGVWMWVADQGQSGGKDMSVTSMLNEFEIWECYNSYCKSFCLHATITGGEYTST